MKKLTFPLILLAFALASCGANSPGTPIESVTSKTEGTSQPATSSQPTITSQAEESDVTVLAALHLGFYNRFANQEAADGFKNGFETYLKEKKVRITSLTIDVIGGSSDNVETFETAVKQNDEAKDYNVDAVLGGKANFVGYVKDNFTSYKDGDAYVEFALGTKTDRRLLLRNDSPNDDALFFLVNYVRTLAGLPEITDDPSEDSSEAVEPVESDPVESEPAESQPGESTPVEESQPETSEPVEASSTEDSAQETSAGTLHVVFYEKQASTNAQDDFKTNFNSYLQSHSITFETLTFDSLTPSGKGAVFATDVEAFEAVDGAYQFDVILGAKANLGTYVTDNFTIYQIDGENATYNLDDKPDRWLYTRNGSVNTAGIQVMIDYLFPAA